MRSGGERKTILSRGRSAGRWLLAAGVPQSVGMFLIGYAISRLSFQDGWAWHKNVFWSAVKGAATGCYLGFFVGTRRSLAVGIIGGAVLVPAAMAVVGAANPSFGAPWSHLWNVYIPLLAFMTAFFKPGKGRIAPAALRGLMVWAILAGMVVAVQTGFLGSLLRPGGSISRPWAGWKHVIYVAAWAITLLFWTPLFWRNPSLSPPTGRRVMALRRWSFSLGTVIVVSMLLTSVGWLWVNRGAWKRTGELAGHSVYSRACHFSPDGSRLITASNGDHVRIWDAESLTVIRTLEGDECPNGDFGWLGDGDRIYSRVADDTIRIWNAETGDGIVDLVCGDKYLSAIAFTGDGSRVAMNSGSATIDVWDTATGARLTSLTGVSAFSDDAAFSPDGRLFAASGGSRDAIQVWETSGWSIVAELDCAGSANGTVFFSPDGKLLLAVYFEGKDIGTQVFDVATWSQAATVKGYPWLNGRRSEQVFSPDGTMLLTVPRGITDEGIFVSDLSSGRLVRVISKTGSGLYQASFLPDGRRVLVADYSGASIWDIETGRRTAHMKGRPYWAAASPDGKTIVVNNGKAPSIWRQTRPEAPYAYVITAEFWATLLFAGLLAWSLHRDTVSFGNAVVKPPKMDTEGVMSAPRRTRPARETRRTRNLQGRRWTGKRTA